jgi:hypothetical protein
MSRRRWILISVAVVVLATASILLTPGLRTPVLRTAGWALVADDPVSPVDIVVVGVDAGDAGVLEAADLVQSGIAKRVAVFEPWVEPATREFSRRGVPYEDETAILIRRLAALGVTNVERIPGGVTGTEDASRVLSGWCAEHRIGSVVVVTNADHSRRLRRIMRRSTDSSTLNVHVRRARYSNFDPDRWWETRDSLRKGIVELQKLVLDVVRHPFSR